MPLTTREYIVRQLDRTKNKKFELYIITGIIHKLNRPDVKFVTQQYVNRGVGTKIALTDLYFPILNLHIEIDEPHHAEEENKELDIQREADIICMTGHDIHRIPVAVNGTIEELDRLIDETVEMIQSKITALENSGDFISWSFEHEASPEFYLEQGYMDANENVFLRRTYEICNCFGHNYSGWQRATAKYFPDDDAILWFPPLFDLLNWDNAISDDEEFIYERNKDDEEAEKHIDFLLNDPKSEKRRLTFVRLQDNFYHFKGMYELDRSLSMEKRKVNDDTEAKQYLVWKRIATRVDTFDFNNIPVLNAQ